MSKKQMQLSDKPKIKYDAKKLTVLNYTVGILVTVIIIFLLFRFVFGVSRVDGLSMSPTLDNEQTVLYTRVVSTLYRGDIVAIDMPSGDHYIKRVIGLPGDTIDVHDNFVYVNGELESTVQFANGVTTPEGETVVYPYTLDPDMYFVMGDNREGSVDSRAFGAVNKAQIAGKVIGG